MVEFFKWSRRGQQTKVVRFGPPKFEGGVYVDNPKEEFYIWASVQPMRTADKDLVQELMPLNRKMEMLRVYADVPLEMDDQINNIRGDRVIIEGENFKVLTLQVWQHLSLRHYKHLVARENRNA